jgi:hypothetical protein
VNQMTSDIGGNVFASEGGRGCGSIVESFALGDQLNGFLGDEGGIFGGILDPGGIAVGANGDLYVDAAESHWIERFPASE